MFSKIAVSLNDLPESQRALRTAISLARKFDASLAAVSILGDPPAYTSFAILIDPGAPVAMIEDRRRLQGLLHEEATKLARAWRFSHERHRRRAGNAGHSPFPEGTEGGSACHWTAPARFLCVASLEFCV